MQTTAACRLKHWIDLKRYDTAEIIEPLYTATVCCTHIEFGHLHDTDMVQHTQRQERLRLH